MEEEKTRLSNINKRKQNKKAKHINKKFVIIFTSAIIATCLLIGLILFFINKIPSQYYGTYTRYYYLYGSESKITYKISALSVESIYEYTKDGKKVTDTRSYEYSKKGNDLIIKDKENNTENYLIIDDDCLYVTSSKDISTSKEYGLYYWNVNSDKADIYEIENTSEVTKELLKETMNTWARKLIYDTANKELKNTSFYIHNSDEKTDTTNLNTFEVIYETTGGKLSLYYNRKTKKLERIYFSGSILSSSYKGTDFNSMTPEDIYDARAMLMSFMYILGNKENIELNIDTENSKEYSKSLADLNYRTKVAGEFDNLFSNKKVDENYDNKYTYSLYNDKYDIDFDSWISSSTYSITGFVSFNIKIK